MKGRCRKEPIGLEVLGVQLDDASFVIGRSCGEWENRLSAFEDPRFSRTSYTVVADSLLGAYLSYTDTNQMSMSILESERHDSCRGPTQPPQIKVTAMQIQPDFRSYLLTTG